MDNFRRTAEGVGKKWNVIGAWWNTDNDQGINAGSFSVYKVYDIPTGTYPAESYIHIPCTTTGYVSVYGFTNSSVSYTSLLILGDLLESDSHETSIEMDFVIDNNVISYLYTAPEGASVYYPSYTSSLFGYVSAVTSNFICTSDGYMYFGLNTLRENPIANTGNANLFIGGQDSNGIFRYKFTKPRHGTQRQPVTVSKEYI